MLCLTTVYIACKYFYILWNYGILIVKKCCSVMPHVVFLVCYLSMIGSNFWFVPALPILISAYTLMYDLWFSACTSIILIAPWLFAACRSVWGYRWLCDAVDWVLLWPSFCILSSSSVLFWKAVVHNSAGFYLLQLPGQVINHIGFACSVNISGRFLV